ncbi:SRPBCC family protein [[Mycobacterium] nativiensis]|uniref:SRPBCC family protein n=1 Tax=[Mycobacterium] nativiensis TaxID=2855503 RepID=A0ABU5XVR5_9MYCO|nr:SRPBCC family protein [Mycolicibacter sp. MYC340]MEB3032035.1 SRPBCC family protein [Mycolicibacter sp. MYC340]
MARGRLEHTADIAAPPEQVAEFLTDLVNYEALHPMLVDVRRIPGGTDGATRYLAPHRMRLYGIPIRFTCRVDLRAEAPGDIRTHTLQRPGIQMWSTLTVRPHAGGTRLHEQVDIKAPRLLMNTVLRDGGSSHAAMWNNLRNYFEG